ncbi:uncharacterized protein [Clytia hemisphaerica]|uniref:uncharacterized protein n=1 Tax=Clytia hemisphaerica TaxID=252671 RepID=UPI0034D469B2
MLIPLLFIIISSPSTSALSRSLSLPLMIDPLPIASAPSINVDQTDYGVAVNYFRDRADDQLYCIRFETSAIVPVDRPIDCCNEEAFLYYLDEDDTFFSTPDRTHCLKKSGLTYSLAGIGGNCNAHLLTKCINTTSLPTVEYYNHGAGRTCTTRIRCGSLYGLRTNEGQCWSLSSNDRFLEVSPTLNCCENNKTMIFERSNTKEKIFDTIGSVKTMNDDGNYWINFDNNPSLATQMSLVQLSPGNNRVAIMDSGTPNLCLSHKEYSNGVPKLTVASCNSTENLFQYEQCFNDKGDMLENYRGSLTWNHDYVLYVKRNELDPTYAPSSDVKCIINNADGDFVLTDRPDRQDCCHESNGHFTTETNSLSSIKQPLENIKFYSGLDTSEFGTHQLISLKLYRNISSNGVQVRRHWKRWGMPNTFKKTIKSLVFSKDNNTLYYHQETTHPTFTITQGMECIPNEVELHVSSGWTYHPNTEYYYKYFDLSLSPLQSNQYCQQYNAVLLKNDRFFTPVIFKRLSRSLEVLASKSLASGCGFVKYNVDTQEKDCIAQHEMASTKLPFVCERKDIEAFYSCKEEEGFVITNGTCRKYVDFPLNWHDARRHCRLYNADLPILREQCNSNYSTTWLGVSRHNETYLQVELVTGEDPNIVLPFDVYFFKQNINGRMSVFYYEDGNVLETDEIFNTTKPFYCERKIQDDIITSQKHVKTEAEEACNDMGKDLYMSTLDRDVDQIKRMPGYSIGIKEYIVLNHNLDAVCITKNGGSSSCNQAHAVCTNKRPTDEECTGVTADNQCYKIYESAHFEAAVDTCSQGMYFLYDFDESDFEPIDLPDGTYWVEKQNGQCTYYDVATDSFTSTSACDNATIVHKFVCVKFFPDSILKPRMVPNYEQDANLPTDNLLTNFDYGYSYYSSNRKYYILPWYLNWKDALDMCIFKGYRIASNFEDQAEIDFVLDKTAGVKGFWMDYNSNYHQNKWASGNNLNASTIIPSTANGCGYFSHCCNMQFTDCQQKRMVVCKFEPYIHHYVRPHYQTNYTINYQSSLLSRSHLSGFVTKPNFNGDSAYLTSPVKATQEDAVRFCQRPSFSLQQFSASSCSYQMIPSFDQKTWLHFKQNISSVMVDETGNLVADHRFNGNINEGDCAVVLPGNREWGTMPCNEKLDFVCAAETTFSASLSPQWYSELYCGGCPWIKGNGYFACYHYLQAELNVTMAAKACELFGASIVNAQNLNDNLKKVGYKRVWNGISPDDPTRCLLSDSDNLTVSCNDKHPSICGKNYATPSKEQLQFICEPPMVAHNDSCYYFDPLLSLPWHQAQSFCNGLNAHLASINNDAEFEVLKNITHDPDSSIIKVYIEYCRFRAV